jgi:hypothetical protein
MYFECNVLYAEATRAFRPEAIRVARIHEMEEGKLAFVRHGLGQELDRKAFNSSHFPV